MNTETPEYERVREEVAKLLFARHGSSCGWLGSDAKQDELLSVWDKVPQYERDGYLEETHQILSTKGVAIEADDQTKPEPAIDVHLWRDCSPGEAYQTAQDDMQDNNFKKVIL
jgi:hypothetical protein